jgi:hypothetical protein
MIKEELLEGLINVQYRMDAEGFLIVHLKK